MRFDHNQWNDIWSLERQNSSLMRDGKQWRPMTIHTADAMIFMLTKRPTKLMGEILNLGSSDNVYQLKPLAERAASCVGLTLN